MNYTTLINVYAKQKADLGMSESYIAEQAGLSQPTVHRIFTGRHERAAWDDMIAIGKVLGIAILSDAVLIEPAEKMLEEQADSLADIIADIMQATSQLEGQGLSSNKQEQLKREAKIKLLSGSRRKLWMEE